MKEASRPDSRDWNFAHQYQGIEFGRRLPVHPTIVASLAAQASSRGDAPFVTAVSPEEEGVTLTYAELDVRSRQLASWLIREFQLDLNDVIGLLPTNDIPSVVSVFGVLRSGSAVLFLNPLDPPARLREQARHLGAKIILRAPRVPAGAFSDAIVVPDFFEMDEEPTMARDSRLQPSADAFFFGTSGSTAASKVVAQSHLNAAVNAEAVRRHHGLRNGDRLLGCLPMHHVNGLHFSILATLTAGGHAILAHAFDPFGYPQLIEHFRPRIASVVPSILEALLETWRSPTFPREFRYFVSAAAPLAATTSRAMRREMGVRVLQGYGLTETTNFSTTMPTDLSENLYRRLMEETEIPSVGTALFGNEVQVLAPDGTHADPGGIGEICMRGHNVMMRYSGNPSETEQAFHGGWFHSGDLGCEVQDPETSRVFIVITGRLKNIAKVRGESVSLDEMNRVLRATPQVEDAACVALPHRFLGDEIIAAVVVPEDAALVDLRTRLKTAFAPTVLPRRIVRLDAIPRTPTGKILRGQLVRLVADTDEDAGRNRDSVS